MSQPDYLSREETTCRSCAGEGLVPILDLGSTPLADRLVPISQAQEEELSFPLKVAFCPHCALVQISETVNPAILYADAYPYYSSFSPAYLEHARKNVEARLAEKDLSGESLVVELASNDGYLLKNYLAAGIKVLGIDPADGPAAAAEKLGVTTLCEFFTEDFAKQVAQSHGQADIVHGNNVLAHVTDLNGFVAGIAHLLKADGMAVIEVPYLLPLIEHIEFDTIYHEHHCYFSVTALDHLCRRNGLFLNRVEQLAIHGGSLRLFIEKAKNQGESVAGLLAHEHEIGLDTPDFFLDFGRRVDDLREKLRKLIFDLTAQGKTIAAYGAAAKGATMVNYCGLDHTVLDFVVDRNVNKQGFLMPGSKIPILAPEALLEKRPDYVLVLAWNFIEEIVEQQSEFLAGGGKFIVPVPQPGVYE